MQTDAKSNDTKALPSRRVVRTAVARWRLGSDDYLASVDMMTPPDVDRGDEVAAPASAFDNSRELAGLVQKSLVRTNEILDLDLAGLDEEETNARARVLLSASRVALQTQLRADANVLKRKATQAHTKMLRDLKMLQDQMNARTVDA